jgi:hypothetical protein
VRRAIAGQHVQREAAERHGDVEEMRVHAGVIHHLGDFLFVLEVIGSSGTRGKS